MTTPQITDTHRALASEIVSLFSGVRDQQLVDNQKQIALLLAEHDAALVARADEANRLLKHSTDELVACSKRPEAAEALVAELKKHAKWAAFLIEKLYREDGHDACNLNSWCELKDALAKTPGDMGAELARLREESHALHALAWEGETAPENYQPDNVLRVRTMLQLLRARVKAQDEALDIHHRIAADARALLHNGGAGPNDSQRIKIDEILREIAGIPSDDASATGGAK